MDNNLILGLVVGMVAGAYLVKSSKIANDAYNKGSNILTNTVKELKK